MDSARASQLYVSDRWEDHPASDYERAIEGKRVTDSIYAAVTAGCGGLSEDHLPEQRR